MSSPSSHPQVGHSPSCKGGAYPFPHRPAGGKCAEQACWLLHAMEVGTSCTECPNAISWHENHGQRGYPGESFFECKLESDEHAKPSDCPFWS